MGLLDRISAARSGRPTPEKRFGLADWAQAYNGFGYPVFSGSPWLPYEDPENSFTGYTQAAYKASGVVFACMLARQLLFSEARFQWQQMRSGRPGDLFGNPDLAVLEDPWPNGTTGELMSRMMQDTDLAGNFYAAREGKRLRRLRPDWVSIILSAPPAEAVESDVVGYLYRPGGPAGPGTSGDGESRLYLPEEIAHWSPYPDPESQYRGMSWLTPVLREIQGDRAATTHKLKFYENGATLSTIVSLDPSVTKENFDRFKAAMDAGHTGTENAYKTMYVGGGADVTVVGANMQQLDFKATQGAGETRIAAAARVHPVIVGLSEGLDGSSLNQGNFNAAKRLFAEGTLMPLWRGAAAALSSIVRVPTGARLWYDTRDIAFLREDAKDAAEIQSAEAVTIRQLVDAGYEPASVVAAVQSQDFSLLTHTGLFSVQLQPPGRGGGDAATPPDVAEPAADPAPAVDPAKTK
jgi:phage portal protein BeeE